jgi:hypothetical protein
MHMRARTPQMADHELATDLVPFIVGLKSVMTTPLSPMRVSDHVQRSCLDLHSTSMIVERVLSDRCECEDGKHPIACPSSSCSSFSSSCSSSRVASRRFSPMNSSARTASARQRNSSSSSSRSRSRNTDSASHGSSSGGSRRQRERHGDLSSLNVNGRSGLVRQLHMDHSIIESCGGDEWRSCQTKGKSTEDVMISTALFTEDTEMAVRDSLDGSETDSLDDSISISSISGSPFFDLSSIGALCADNSIKMQMLDEFNAESPGSEDVDNLECSFLDFADHHFNFSKQI